MAATNEFIQLGSHSELNSASEFAISIWVYGVFSTHGNARIISHETTGAPRLIPIYISTADNKINCYFQGANRAYCGFPSDSTWVQILVSYDGTESTHTDRVKIYFDGVSQSLSHQGTIPATTDNSGSIQTTLGNRTHAGPYEFTGRACDLAFYNKHKHTQAEVDNIYNSGSYIDPRRLPAGYGLYAYYRPQSSVGDTVYVDEMGNYEGAYYGGFMDETDLKVGSPF